MATQIISNSSEQFPRQFKSGNYSRRKNISASKRFRLSDIAVDNKVECLPFEMNKLLFNLNLKYNANFDITKQIKYSDLSNELIRELQNRFEIDLNRINISTENNHIVIDEHLKYDMYDFEIKPFLKLEKKAPALYEAFIFFMRSVPFVILDEAETLLLDNMTIEWLEILIDENSSKKEKNIYRKAIKEYKQNISFLKGLKSNYNKEEVKNILIQYKPKKQLYKEIKLALLNWLEIDFSFYNAYPYQYYSNLNYQQNIEEQGSFEECYDFAEFIYFSYTSNETLLAEVKQRFEDIYNNNEITNPCWLINLEEEQSFVNKSIKEFENFTIQYINIIKQL